MDDRFSDDELGELLRAVIAMVREVPADDPGLASDVDRVVAARGQRE